MTSENQERRIDPEAHPNPGMSLDGKRKIPVPKKKQPATYRVLPREQRHGLVIVNTGDGKGKTTAALGLLLRAAGREMSVGMFQFIKGERVADFGEQVAARRLGVDITQLGAGCIAWRKDLDADRARAEAGWERCKAMMLDGTYDILILDELTNVIRRGWLDAKSVVETLQARPTGTHVVITGRSAPQELIDAADLVTEMRVIKHPLREQGVGAQAGIDV